MVDKFRASEAQEWNSHGNMGRGKVKKKLTTRTLIKGHALAASGQPDGLDNAAEGEGGLDPRAPSPSIERAPTDER